MEQMDHSDIEKGSENWKLADSVLLSCETSGTILMPACTSLTIIILSARTVAYICVPKYLY